MKPLTYLAVPYSHPDPEVRKFRFDCVNKAAGKMMNEGLLVFSPISHSHPIAEVYDLPTTWEYWERFCRAYMSHCSSMVVLTLPGWQQSVGVTAERNIARELNITTRLMTLREI